MALKYSSTHPLTQSFTAAQPIQSPKQLRNRGLLRKFSQKQPFSFTASNSHSFIGKIGERHSV
jgi:hypothetical protein